VGKRQIKYNLRRICSYLLCSQWVSENMLWCHINNILIHYGFLCTWIIEPVLNFSFIYGSTKCDIIRC
jgi:hypothetical protein